MHILHKRIAELIPTLHGWSEVDKVQRMASLVVALRAECSVEIGIYGGRSFLGLALAHSHMAHGTAIAIDPWTNEAACEGYEGQNETFWRNNPLEQIYQSFMDAVRVAEVGHRINVIRKRSDDVTPPDVIDVLSVDGQHSEQAVRDVQRFGSRVRKGGFCFLDDLDWMNNNDSPVKRALGELKALGFVELYPLGTGVVTQRL